MAEMYQDIKDKENEFKSFDDSLAGNPNFRKRLLDTVSTASELRQVRENQKDELIKKAKTFTTRYPDHDKVIMKHKILDGVNNLINVIFICMAIPLLIYLFKRR